MQLFLDPVVAEFLLSLYKESGSGSGSGCFSSVNSLSVSTPVMAAQVSRTPRRQRLELRLSTGLGGGLWQGQSAVSLWGSSLLFSAWHSDCSGSTITRVAAMRRSVPTMTDKINLLSVPRCRNLLTPAAVVNCCILRSESFISMQQIFTLLNLMWSAATGLVTWLWCMEIRLNIATGHNRQPDWGNMMFKYDAVESEAARREHVHISTLRLPCK